MTSAATTIQNTTNYTTETQSKTDTATGAASANLSSTDFLNLLLKQLQYQDPMSPTDNSQFVSQQCQFAQLEATDTMSENIANNNAITEATSLVGETVVLTDPNDSSKTIYGTVASAEINGSKSGIAVNGTVYQLSSIKYVVSKATASSITSAQTTTTTQQTSTTTTSASTKTS